MKKTLATAALLGAALTPFSAGAAVLSWDYSMDSRFESPSYSPIDGGSGTGTPSSGPYDLSWGSDSARSSLHIRDQDGTVGEAGAPATGSVLTNGGLELGNRFFHNNVVIPVSSFGLDEVTITIDFDLTATAPPEEAGETSVDISPFLLNFRETPNSLPCESGVGGEACADIFVLTSDVPFFEGFFTYDFLYNGEQYFLDLTAAGLAALTDDQCTAAGASTGCIGFITPEGMLNMSQLSFRIRHEDVPEPAALSLLGLGLAGLGMARRRKA